jgi:cell division protein FtsB
MLRYALLFVTIVLIADAVVGEKGLLALMQARREFRAVDLALQRAREENAALREEARRLREDPSAVEALARRDLGLIKPGELLFIVKDVQKKN